MSIRISQRQMYSSFVSQMNQNLAALMESNLQGASEKRINRPSDDPAGAARVLMQRATLDNIDQYKKNISTATGWLSTMDQTLIQVQQVLSEIKAKVEGAATGTYTSENRQQVSYYLRQQLSSLIGLANTPYAGQNIFAGHKTDQAAYAETLYATINDANFAGAEYVVAGGASYTTLIQFTQDGTTGGGEMTFRYSQDGGDTWLTGTTTGGGTLVQAGGVQVTLPAGRTVTAVDTANVNENNNGTWLYVRPSAVYLGDDNGSPVVQSYGTAATATADGYFPRDVAVRIDDATGPPMKYSYSLDDGSNWTQATAPAGSTSFPIPGGFLNTTGALADGAQFNVHPRRANINIEISPNSTITVNMVGKDIFGGLFQEPFTSSAQPVQGSGNLFETIGRAIMYAETGSQQGMQQALAELTECMKVVTTKATEAGARENRLSVVFENVTMRELDESDTLSKIEDVDVTVLMTRLAQQQLAYNTVLKSSSMIMQMSLVNFI